MREEGETIKMDQKKLTDRQNQVLNFIKDYISEYRYPPSFQDIGTAFDFSVKAANDHIQALVKKGYIEYEEDRPRMLKVIQDDKTRIIRAKADMPACSIRKGDYVHVEGGKVVGITRDFQEE